MKKNSCCELCQVTRWSQWKVLIDFSCGIHKGWRRHSNVTKKTDEFWFTDCMTKGLCEKSCHITLLKKKKKKEKSSEYVHSLGSSWILAAVRKWSRSLPASDTSGRGDLGHTSLHLCGCRKPTPPVRWGWEQRGLWALRLLHKRHRRWHLILRAFC